ncbi:TonB-dependent receptor [Hymenobacter caeli]|uniref:Outer membrane receptor protein involved in Fe transport n=1 Tax=Hymenobacter caeli TaxID=2735894 RepID=A0ABX2FUG8_9BACT|nr:TonB-dependent receptor [Hymenobacter caeli]NRT20820.1 outer membrane receptor protein involved in Fe transport [Hymenobacter caeli]
MNSHLRIFVRHLFATLVLLGLAAPLAFAQSGRIAGKITDTKGGPQIGATVVVEETKAGASTNADGTFLINNVPNGSYTLRVSYVGALSQTKRVTVPGAENVAMTLQEDTKSLDEVIVTGVFDKRTRMESSVAISTLNAKQIDRLVPQSAADLLKNVPGVYVNTSAGEVHNVVYSRGVSANSVGSLADPTNGYYYVSLQEDGLPVTAVSSGTISSDYFFRNDATIQRLEAVRGGTSSITSANAPGGIFNFLTKTGVTEGQNEVRLRYGLEGNGKQPYYRADVNYGDKIGDKGLSYNVGGFYRYANGARYAGYPFNEGGQFKFNITKASEKGSIRFYAKYLDDHNGVTVPLVGQGFNNDIRLAPGVEKTDSYLLNGVSTQIPNGSATNLITFDPTNLAHSRDFTAGLSFNYDLSDTWTLTNNGKYSRKNLDIDTNIATNFTYLNDFVTGVFTGSLNLGPGLVTYRDRSTGAVLAQVQQGFAQVPGAPAGTLMPTSTVLNSTLNGPVPNALRYSGSLKSQTKLDEFVDQLTLSKRLANGSINGGIFFSSSHIVGAPEMLGAVLGLSQIGSRADLVDVTFQHTGGPMGGPGPGVGPVYQVSQPGTGYLKLGGSFGYGNYDYQNNQIAGFLGNTLNFGEQLSLDYGVRFEHISLKGTNFRTVPANPTGDPNFGGIDGNPLTIYDNYYGVLGQNNVAFNKQLNTFSYSAGLNYKINDRNAVYVRYTRGQKSPDLSFYQTYQTGDIANGNDPQNQNINQVELGYKVKTNALSLALTPFYSLLSNVGTTTLANDENNQLYYTPIFYNKVQTFGVELEGDYTPFRSLNIRGAVTVQSAKYPTWKTYNVGGNGRADDVVVDYSGNKAENNPSVIITLTPTYSVGKFYALVQWKYLGDRQANQGNAYYLPAFSQFDAAAGYSFTKKISMALNVNNIFDVLGIMGSSSPGSILESFSPQNLTKAQVQANPNAVHSIVPIQPRAYFLSAVYKF